MEKGLKKNNEIRAQKISVVMPDGQFIKEMSTQEALCRAEEEDLDLVEINPSSNDKLSICKIMDYSKYCYDKSKSEKHQQHSQHLKEIKFKLNISPHDLETKCNKVKELLMKKNKVLFMLELKSRQKSRIDDASIFFKSHLEKFKELATWEEPRISDGKIFVSFYPLKCDFSKV